MRRAAASLFAVSVFLVGVSALAVDAAPRPPSDSLLLRRHLPVLVAHPAERFGPVAADAFFEASDQLVRRPDGTFTEAQPGETPTRLDVPACTVATGPDGIDCYAPLSVGPPTVYGAVHRRPGRIVLQYWFFSVVNLWSPVVPVAANAWQAHEGDWEHIALVLDAGGAPLEVGFAQHCGGVRVPWTRTERLRGTMRPVVYVGFGSHASYPKPGVRPTDPKCWPDPKIVLSVFDALGYRLVDHAGGGSRTMSPRLVRLTASSPTWASFAGTWGEDRYVRLGDVTFKDGAGPTGPAHKRAWREPVRTVASWPLAR